VKLLDGSYTSQDFQIGSGNTSNDRISISITKVTAGGLGVASFNTTSGTIASGTSSISANTIKINGVDIGAVAAGADQAGTLANTVAAINTVTGQTGISAAVSSGNIKFTSVKGDTSFTLSGTGATVANVGVAAGTITLTTDTNDTGLNAIDLTTQAGAQSALDRVDHALNTVTDGRAAMGAYQNRFNAAITNLSTSTMNLQASRSRILDADYATETTNLAKSQIITQAATAMLAQANQSSQSVLALLK
jgi:flagellin